MSVEYIPVDPRRLHPSTLELVRRRYFYLKDIYPWDASIRQIYNTLQACAPDIHAAIAEVKRGEQRLLADMCTYPTEAWKLSQTLSYIEDFFECVQEASAKLHNTEPARRATIEALNRLRAKAERIAEEERQRWMAEVAAGDAYFGGPGSYQQVSEEYFAATDMKQREALRARIRAFQHAYQTTEPEPAEHELVQAGLWG